MLQLATRPSCLAIKLRCFSHLLRYCTCASSLYSATRLKGMVLLSGNKLNAVLGGAGGEGVKDSGDVAYSGNNNSGDFSSHGGIAMDSSNGGNAFGGEPVHYMQQ